MNPQSLQKKLQHVVQQDPRKAGVLGALLLVLGFMVVRVVSSAAQTPSTAHAAHPNLRVETSGLAGVGGPDGARPSTGSPAARWLDQPPPTAPKRNIFAVRLDAFPLEVTKPPEEGENRGFWDEIAKSMSDQDDQLGKKQELLQHVQSQARDLTVASIMMGPTPRALINDKLVGEGDVVAEFRVLRIEARRIIVERAGIRLEITMN